MPDSPYGAMPPGPAPWPQQGFPPARGPSRLPVFIALGVAVVALGLAIGAWFRPAATTPAAPTSPQYSEQEVADAKTAVCDAYRMTTDVVRRTGGLNSPDPTLTWVYIVNMRLAFQSSGDYLRVALSENPAAPEELAKNIRDLASAFQEVVISQFAGKEQSELGPINARMDSAGALISEACK